MLLIITGCISVDDKTPYTFLRDERLRLEGYKETIRWAVATGLFNKIVFCENSGYSFDASGIIGEGKSDVQYEYLTFKGNREAVIEHGKGYGEGEIILYAMNHSVLLRDEEYFMKITGRLSVKNIRNLIKSTEKNYFMRKQQNNQIDTRLYYVSKCIYMRHLSKCYKKVDDHRGYILESTFYDALTENSIPYRSFYEKPVFDGVAGSTGRNYSLEHPSKLSWAIDFLCRLNLYNNSTLQRIFHSIK